MTSIYSSLPFKDESFDLKHDRAGLLSMANSGVDSNGCQVRRAAADDCTRLSAFSPFTAQQRLTSAALCVLLYDQFFITCGACEWLDGKHVVFGSVIDGMLAVRKMEQVPTGNNSRPKLSVTVAQCGEL